MPTPQPLLSYARAYGEVNVLTFGADPTAGVSSSVAFAAAAAECKAKGFSTLYVPTGNYLLDEPWLLEDFAGLRIHGDGDRRNLGSNYDPGSTGSVLFLINDALFGIVFDTCQSCCLDALTFVGSVTESLATANGVNIKGGSSAVQVRNCSFHYFNICLQCGVGTGEEGTDSETVVSNVQFSYSNIGYRTTHIQSLVNRFDACSCTDLDVMFDLVKGGNLTVKGFGGANTKVFVRADLCGGGQGFNQFFNVRLDAVGETWPDENRTKIFDGVNEGSSYNAFFGLVIGGNTEQPTGITRFTLRPGHWVMLHNATDCSANFLGTPDSPLVSFTGSGSGLAIFRAFNIDVAPNARVLIAPASDPPIASFARYSFTDCAHQYEPTPDAFHTPLYAPNYLVVCESHCFAKDFGLNGVNAFTSVDGNAVVDDQVSDEFRAGVLACSTTLVGTVALASGLAAMKLTGGAWKFQTAVRIPTLSGSPNSFVTRLGYGDMVGEEPNNGVYFQLRDDSDPVEWEAVVISGGSPVTVTSTGVAPDTNWHGFEIRTDAAGSSSFFIDGVRRAVISGFPTAHMGLLPLQVSRLGAVSAAERSAQIDYYRYLFRPTTNDKFPPET